MIFEIILFFFFFFCLSPALRYVSFIDSVDLRTYCWGMALQTTERRPTRTKLRIYIQARRKTLSSLTYFTLTRLNSLMPSRLDLGDESIAPIFKTKGIHLTMTYSPIQNENHHSQQFITTVISTKARPSPLLHQSKVLYQLDTKLLKPMNLETRSRREIF